MKARPADALRFGPAVDRWVVAVLAFAGLAMVAATVGVALASSVVSSTTAAWTFRRVQLVDRRGRVVEVGPADRVGFVAEVLARAPQLVEDRRTGPGRAWHDPGARRR